MTALPMVSMEKSEIKKQKEKTFYPFLIISSKVYIISLPIVKNEKVRTEKEHGLSL